MIGSDFVQTSVSRRANSIEEKRIWRGRWSHRRNVCQVVDRISGRRGRCSHLFALNAIQFAATEMPLPDMAGAFLPLDMTTDKFTRRHCHDLAYRSNQEQHEFDGVYRTIARQLRIAPDLVREIMHH